MTARTTPATADTPPAPLRRRRSADPPPAPVLLDVHGVAALLAIGWRHVLRLRDSGKLPAPLKLGASVRWRQADVLAWIDAGCPTCRTGSTRGTPRR